MLKYYNIWNKNSFRVSSLYSKTHQKPQELREHREQSFQSQRWFQNHMKCGFGMQVSTMGKLNNT